MRDPLGIHGLIWSEFTGRTEGKPTKPLALVACEEGSAASAARAYLQPIDVGAPLPEMPLFLRTAAPIELPLEKAFDRAFSAIPKRWQDVLQIIVRKPK